MNTDPNIDAGAERPTGQQRIDPLEGEQAGAPSRLAKLDQWRQRARAGEVPLSRLAPRMNNLSPHQVMLGLVVVLVLLLSVLATDEARVPFALRVAGTHATLLVDGRTLSAAWPEGVTHAVPSYSGPQARLFQLSGTDFAGTTSTDPASLSSSTYFQVDCWIRECDSYSQWGNFQLRNDSTGAVLLRHADPTTLSLTVLPTQFTLQGDLQRPDVASSISFTGIGNAQITIDPNGRSVTLNGTSQYYPHDWVPYLGEVGWTLSRAALWAFALLAFIIILSAIAAAALAKRWPAAELPSPPSGSLSRWLAAVPFVAAGVMLLELGAVSNFTYQQLPRVFDAIAYYFQGVIFSSGHLALATPPGVGFFSGPFMVNYNGHWFSHYPPGAPLALALGMLVKLPWLVEPVLGALGVLMMADLARRWYGESTMLLAVLLLALSPFYLFLASSYMSHMISLFALLVFLEGVDRLTTTGDWRWGLMASAGVGYAGLTRELAVILFAIPVVIFYVVRTAPALLRRFRTAPFPWSRAAKIAAALIVPALCCGAFYLYYDWRLTGQPTLTPRTVFDARDTWGFGVGKGWWNLHTPAAGLFVMDNQLTSLLTHLYGWPYYLTLSFFLLPLLTLRLRAYDLLLYSIAALFLLGYAGLYYHGIAFGPRYLFESIPAYVLLTARGIGEAAAIAATLLRRVTRWQVARAGGLIGTGVALVLLCACNVGFYLPRQFSLYYDYLEQRVDGGLGYDRLHPSWMHNAIVLTGDSSFYGDVLFPLNDPQLNGDILYALTPPSQNIMPLMTAYPHRALYWASISQRHLDFVRMHVLRAPTHTVTLKSQQSSPQLANLAMDKKGNLLAANIADGTVVRYSPAGAQLGTIATGISHATFLPIAIRRQALYWFDVQTSALWRANLQGGHRSRTVLQPPCPACHAFAFAPNGDIVFAATSEGELYRYSPQGKRLASSGQGLMRQPASVAVTADGRAVTYDLELKRTFMFDQSLRLLQVLPFGSDGPGGFAISLLATAGDWVVGTDPGLGRLVAYNVRTGVLRDAMLNARGDILSFSAFGLAWNGRQLAIATGSPPVVQIVSTGAVPF